MAFLIKPDPEECRELGIPRLGHIPGIWSDEWTPEAEAIDYLVAKGTGRWSEGQFRSSFALHRPMSRSSMLAIGHDLTNFLDWCERSGVDWRTITYDQLIEDYQEDMASGEWSRLKKHKLSASTINRRLVTTIDFLNYAVKRKFRGPFEVEFTTISAPTAVRAPRSKGADTTTPQRAGKVRAHPKHLRLPTLDETAKWLADLRSKHGITPHLMAKTVVGLGLRADEVGMLRLSQLPKIPSATVKTVTMEICFGTKGGRNPHDPEKRGKARDVRIQIELLKELHGYASGHRRLCLSVFEKQNPGEEHPQQLFLSKNTGKPLSYSRFYELWTSPALPFEHFSPHIGRHIWACYTLIEKIREEIELSVGVSGPIAHIASNLHQNLIETWISTQLGHVDQATSDMYLNWVTDHIDPQSHHASWFDYLNE